MNEESWEAFGARLRECREDRGLSLRDISGRTRIPLGVLEALESGDGSGLPAPVFVKGFLKSYALEIGLEPSEVIRDYRTLVQEIDEPLPMPVTARPAAGRGSSLGVIILVLVLILGAVGGGSYYYFFYTPRQVVQPAGTTAIEPKTEPVDEPRPPAEPIAAEEPEAEVSKPAALETSAMALESEKEKKETGQAGETDPEEGGALDEKQKPAVDESPAPDESLVAKPRPGGHELKMVFSQTTWVRVTLDGKTIRQGLFLPGASKTWTAEKQFVIRVGNAGGVRLFLDGQALDNLGPSGRVVDLTLPLDGN
ncbi:MAG: DUF4115 domain-containing protein [Thermodesulfobacteriota bacterium]|nr:DUF4115 domain-containing protein [Thermodesulfobacteriota bacterium]